MVTVRLALISRSASRERCLWGPRSVAAGPVTVSQLQGPRDTMASMRKTCRAATALALGAALLVTTGAAQATTLRQATTNAPPGIYGADPRFRSVIEAAIDRYESIGLDLPPLRIYVHSTQEGCQGELGTYGQYGSTDRIDLCTEAKFYVLHELAHAWEQHAISDETRRAVLDQAELDVWHDRGIPWLRSGAEIAANTIAFGLLDLPLTETEAGYFEVQLSRFRLLTGANSPRIE